MALVAHQRSVIGLVRALQREGAFGALVGVGQVQLDAGVVVCAALGGGWSSAGVFAAPGATRPGGTANRSRIDMPAPRKLGNPRDEIGVAAVDHRRHSAVTAQPTGGALSELVAAFGGHLDLAHN